METQEARRRVGAGKRLAAAGALLLAVTSCTTKTRHAESSTGPALPLTTASSRDTLTGETLTAFQTKISKKHRAAVMLGVCAGWENVGGGITVTLNPGVAIGTTKDGSYEQFLVFTTLDRTTHQYLFMNGPGTTRASDGSITSNTQNVLFTSYAQGGINYSPNTDVSSKLVGDKNGQWYYTDKATKVPVIDTVITNGPLTTAHVEQECSALRNHQDVHAVTPSSDAKV